MTREEIEKLGMGLEVLGIEAEELNEVIALVRGANSRREAVVMFGVWKAGIKKLWKRGVFELHPDRGGNEVEFKKVCGVMDMLDRMNVRGGGIGDDMKVIIKFY